MGRKLNGSSKAGQWAPTAQLKEDGASMTGVLMGTRTARMGYGEVLIAQLKLVEANCRFTLDKTDVTPAIGTVVDFVTSTRSARQIREAKVGETLSIVYEGLQEVGGGIEAHVHTIEVV